MRTMALVQGHCFCSGERNQTECIAFRSQVHDLETHYAVLYPYRCYWPLQLRGAAVYTPPEVLGTQRMNGGVVQKVGFCHASKARGHKREDSLC